MIEINTNLNEYIIKDLKELCKKNNIIGYSKKNKGNQLLIKNV
jgi:hypothetical protein